MTSILVAAMIAAAQPAPISPADSVVLLAAADDQASEQVLYTQGTEALDRGDFDQAAKAFGQSPALATSTSSGRPPVSC